MHPSACGRKWSLKARRWTTCTELFVYTDGINEAENINKEQFGDERLRALLQKDLGDARQTSETVHKAVEDFVGEAEPTDDLTKMCIKM